MVVKINNTSCPCNYVYLREEIVNMACLVGKTVKNQMKWAGHMVRMKGEITEKIGDKETRKATAKMGEVSEERSKKGWGRRKVERKGQQQGAMGENNKSSHRAVMSVQPHRYNRDIIGITRYCFMCGFCCSQRYQIYTIILAVDVHNTFSPAACYSLFVCVHSC